MTGLEAVGVFENASILLSKGRSLRPGLLIYLVMTESLCGVTGPDVVILSDDFAEMERK